MTWAYMYVMGFFFIGYSYKFNRQLMRVQYKTLAIWSAFLVFAIYLRTLLFKIPFIQELIDVNLLASMDWYLMVLAGFEEAMFTLPIYYVMKYCDNKWIRALLMSAMAAVFASGHTYQGWFAVIPTFIYMRYLAPVFMDRIGFYSMVICHILFDLSILATAKIIQNPDLLNFSLYLEYFRDIIN